MKKYREEFYTVREKGTYKKICDCGSWEDARMMLHLDTQNREIIKNRHLMDTVVNVEVQKLLPTNEIVNFSNETKEYITVKEFPQIKLPESQETPIVI